METIKGISVFLTLVSLSTLVFCLVWMFGDLAITLITDGRYTLPANVSGKIGGIIILSGLCLLIFGGIAKLIDLGF